MPNAFKAVPASGEQFEPVQRLSVKQLPQGVFEQKQRQEAARRRTLVLAYLPRSATESDISAAVDSALGVKNCVTRAKIARNSEGTSACYGFFEFTDPLAATDAFEACHRGKIVIDDESGHTWHLRASRARRATVAADASARSGRRARGRRGGGGGTTKATEDGAQLDMVVTGAGAPMDTTTFSPIRSDRRRL